MEKMKDNELVHIPLGYQAVRAAVALSLQPMLTQVNKSDVGVILFMK